MRSIILLVLSLMVGVNLSAQFENDPDYNFLKDTCFVGEIFKVQEIKPYIYSHSQNQLEGIIEASIESWSLNENEDYEFRTQINVLTDNSWCTGMVMQVDPRGKKVDLMGLFKSIAELKLEIDSGQQNGKKVDCQIQFNFFISSNKLKELTFYNVIFKE